MGRTSEGGTAFGISIGSAFIGGYADEASFYLLTQLIASMPLISRLRIERPADIRSWVEGQLYRAEYQ